MKFFICLMILIDILISGVFGHTCGINPGVKPKPKIPGGTKASFNEFPWQVLVTLKNEKGQFVKPHCGAVLVSHGWALTAKNCLPKANQSIELVVGEYDIESSSEPEREITKKVAKTIKHKTNDLVLLKLDSPVKCDNHIRPICLPKLNEDFKGEEGIVTGWGSKTFGGKVSNILKKVEVPILSPNECKKKWPKYTFSKEQICAGHKDKANFCESDQGGAMQHMKGGVYTLVGISAVVLPGKCALPGIYVSASGNLDWIKKNMK